VINGSSVIIGRKRFFCETLNPRYRPSIKRVVASIAGNAEKQMSETGTKIH
jgi:hypothetical protein